MESHRSRIRPRVLQRSANVKGATGGRGAKSTHSELQQRKAGLKWSRRLHDPRLKNSLGISGVCTSAIEHNRPNATDQERSEGERQCREDNDRRSVTRAVIAREPELCEVAARAVLESPGPRRQYVR